MAQPMRCCRCLKGIVTLYIEGGGDTSKINRRHCQLRVKCALALSILACENGCVRILRFPTPRFTNIPYKNERILVRKMRFFRWNSARDGIPRYFYHYSVQILPRSEFPLDFPSLEKLKVQYLYQGRIA